MGVGINDADYAVTEWETIEVNGVRKQKLVWECPYYRTWKGMLMRCYSAKYQETHPTYKGCSVSKEWITFSNFRAWMEKQDFVVNQLDKDLLFECNKVYSADTCTFVTRGVNLFTTDCGASRGEWMIGVYWNKTAGKFMSRCCNPFTKKQEYLGLFVNELEAHKAWLKRKLELAHLIAEEQADERVAKALIARYTILNQWWQTLVLHVLRLPERRSPCSLGYPIGCVENSLDMPTEHKEVFVIIVEFHCITE